MVTLKHKGNFNNTEKFLTSASKLRIEDILRPYGEEGVRALSSATPVDTGTTASSWGYSIRVSGSTYSIWWSNTNINRGVPIAIVLQYGHATGTGGYVQGRDYINPALAPIFDKIADQVWQEVRKL